MEVAMKVGFIGLGNMGVSMAYNILQGGHALVVHDIGREAAIPHLEAGATWADTPREAAEAADVVFTSLPGPTEVEAVSLGEDGLLSGMSEGKVYFDLSTNSPALARRIYQVFSARGIHMLDAPVSGGPRGARTRNLAIWVGGDEEVYQRYKPLLDAIGDKAYYVGPIGCGSIAKLVHNCAGYVIQCALAEVFTMGVKASGSPGSSRAARRVRGPSRAPAAREIRPPRLRPSAGPQGRGPGGSCGTGVRRPHAPREPGPARTHRSHGPRLGARDSRVAMLLQEERADVEVRVPEDVLRQTLEGERSGG